MKATSFLLDETRTPICHSLFHPGGIKALLDEKLATEDKKKTLFSIPLQELGRVSEPERSLLVLDVISRQKLIHLLELKQE
jgi:hypothetical protein